MNIKKIAVAAALGVAVFATAACGSDAAPAASSAASAAGSAAGSMTSEMGSETMESPMESGTMESGSMESGSGAMDPAADLVGAGCAGYAEANPDGAGSVGGMATAKVADAAAANPLLKTLVAAVSGKVNPKVDLVDTLNGGEFTVFAPVDDAFAKIDAGTMKTLTTDADLLSTILTYHVVEGQIAPADIVGTHPTVAGPDLEVTGDMDNLKVNGESTVICGGVKTANATVYLIDTVLMPPADGAAASSDAESSMATTS